jgi:hypothetical protein
MAHAQAAPAHTANEHALQQTKSLSSGARQTLTICLVAGETSAIGSKLVPANMDCVVIAYHYPPGVLRHRS